VSPAPPVVSGQQAVISLGKLGFEVAGQRGSHVKLRNGSGRVVIVPLHRELARGTLGAILRQSGVTVSEFIELL
jgi:predicted RNA binding protein YcfA (HicA-like mRNA interferase family)